MIVVTAAGGPTGTAVVRELRARGLPVRAVVGRPGPRPELRALAAEVVVAELTRPPAWAGVLTGADALYLIWPNVDPGEAEGAAAQDAVLDGAVPRDYPARCRPPRAYAGHLADVLGAR